MFFKIIAVGIGGFVGAILRSLISDVIPQVNGFPLATLLINLFGSFLLVYILTAGVKKWQLHPTVILGVGTGLIGSFTTFSTFSVETLHLIENHAYILAAIYILLSLVGGFTLSFIGFLVAKKR